ncbi:NPL4 family protein, partial [Toxoplasma gondii MAS]
MEKLVVLRLRAREGHSRVEVSPQASLAEVYARVSEQLRLPRDALEIFLDQRHRE